MEQILSKILDQVEVIDELIDDDCDNLQHEVDVLWTYLITTKHDHWLNCLRDIK
tara:strand:- start:453 stop:614 length:162 start_codon:yes stop_codon:yes gene_type:complete